MLTSAEMSDIIARNRVAIEEAYQKLDKLYERTDRMCTAIANGGDKDKLFQSWAEMCIDKMETSGKTDKAWYNAHATALALMLDEWIVALENKDKPTIRDIIEGTNDNSTEANKNP